MFGFGPISPTQIRTGTGGRRLAGRLSIFAAISAVAAGVLVLLGWSSDIEVLKRVHPDFVAMNPVTALCVILSGVSIALCQLRYRHLSCCVGLTVATIAAVKLVDLGFGTLPIDRLLFIDRLDLPLNVQPSRMAPNTAVAFLLAGLALSLATPRDRTAKLKSQALAVGVLLISAFALIGYAFNIPHLRIVGPFVPMALHTGASLLVIGAGILCLNRDVGVMVVLRDAGPAGSMARTILPIAIAIAVAIGAAQLWGQHHGYYGAEAGVALQVTANVLVTSLLLVASVFALYRSDAIRKDREEALRQSEQFYRTINDASPDCVSLLDTNGKVLFFNGAALRAFGHRNGAELLGRRWGECMEGSIGFALDGALDVARRGEVGRITLARTNMEGDLRWYESLISELEHSDDQPMRFIVMSRDITQQKRAEEQARWAASHDALTQLPNRCQFQARLDQMLAGPGRKDFALLLLDIDDFKHVNDSLGHDAGDTLLCTVAERLVKAVGPEDFVARLGSDEFALILGGIDTAVAATAAATRIVKTLKKSWTFNGRPGDLRISIGASLARIHGPERAALLKNADIALNSAKARGRIAIFHPDMRTEIEQRASKISLARHALLENLILPFYQPKVELGSGRLIGFEALLRWRHPTRGFQSPASIDAAFEDLELAQKLTDRVLTHVLADMRRWLDAGVQFGHVAVNVASADFKQKDFATRLLERLDAQAIPRHCLQMEVTETVFMGRGAEYVAHALEKLSSSGIRIALDDFGTGYASLSHLKQFPVDIVKIDRSFLRDIQKDEHNAAIIDTVISLGQSLQLDVVAEGVENTDQQAYLIAQGCKYGQGHLYGKATPAALVPELIKAAAQGASQAA